MRKFLLLIIFFPCIGIAQNYVDLVKIGYGQSFKNDFENSNSSTQIQFSEIDITFPVVLNENNAFITGLSFSQYKLQLFPEANNTNLFSTLLKVGLASTYNEKWSSTIVFLPKISSNYKNISSEDFFFGGFGILKYKKKQNLIYRFGIYSTSEAYGLYLTPILGWYYLSTNEKFEMDVALPISVDINYNFGFTSLGFDFYGIGRSYNLKEENQPNYYTDQSSIEFSGYLQFNLLHKSALLRAKAGYSISNYEVYSADDKVDLALPLINFGDDRTLLNPDISGGVFLKVEAIYRFQIKNKK